MFGSRTCMRPRRAAAFLPLPSLWWEQQQFLLFKWQGAPPQPTTFHNPTKFKYMSKVCILALANSILAQSQFILVSYIIKSLLFPSLLQPWGFRFAIGSLARLRKSQRKPASRRKTSARDLPRTAVAAAAPVKMLRRLRKVPRRRRKAERLETSRRRTRRSLKQKKTEEQESKEG